MLIDKIVARCIPLVEIPEFEENMLRMMADEQRHSLYDKSHCEVPLNDDKAGQNKVENSEVVSQEVIELLDYETQTLKSPIQLCAENAASYNITFPSAVSDRKASCNFSGTTQRQKSVPVSFLGETENERYNKSLSKRMRESEHWIVANDSKASNKKGMKQQSLMLHFQPLHLTKRNKS